MSVYIKLLILPSTQVGMDQSPEHRFSEVLPARMDYEVSTGRAFLEFSDDCIRSTSRSNEHNMWVLLGPFTCAAGWSKRLLS